MCVKGIKGNLHNIRDMQDSIEILLSWKWANLSAEGQGQLLSERFTIILRYHSIRNIMLCVVSIYKNIAYFSCLEFPVGLQISKVFGQTARQIETNAQSFCILLFIGIISCFALDLGLVFDYWYHPAYNFQSTIMQM